MSRSASHRSRPSAYEIPANETERAILVQVSTPDDSRAAEDAVAELQALTESAGARIVGQIRQNRRSPDHSTYLGKGRLEDLAALSQEENASLVIFGHDLSPAQARNVEQTLDLRVIDRSQLIMDIFALRARTAEARLQVELAQLQYSLPRLRRLWTHLDRYKGGGVGMRGPGETQLESDRREIGRRITDRRKKLQTLEKQHRVQRQRRGAHFTVGLIGYTNAGKSTLFNRLTEASVAAENRPFSTLDTRTRAWDAGKGCEFLLSDTIGFIHELPHHLIASFHATLAEAVQADLLFHVVDGSRADRALLARSVEDVLQKIGGTDRARILVVNKVDAATDRVMLGEFGARPVYVSAKTGEGLDLLAQTACEFYRSGFQEWELRIPFREAASIAAIENVGDILEREHEATGIRLTVRLPASMTGMAQRFSLNGW